MRGSFFFPFVLAVIPAAAAPAPLLTADGFGPFHIGMTEAEARKIPGMKLGFSWDASGDANLCETGEIPGSPGMYMMLVHRRIVVIGGGFSTSDGVQIGTTEAQLKRIFGSRAIFTDRAYFEGDPQYHQVTVKLNAEREFVFETDHGIVDTIRVGDLPGVEFMEGCA